MNKTIYNQDYIGPKDDSIHPLGEITIPILIEGENFMKMVKDFCQIKDDEMIKSINITDSAVNVFIIKKENNK